MTSCERPPQGREVGGPVPRGRPKPLADLRPQAGRGAVRCRGHPATPARCARRARRRPRDARRVRDARPGRRPTRSRSPRRHVSTTRASTTATSRPILGGAEPARARSESGSPAGRPNGSRRAPARSPSARRSTCSEHAPAAGRRGRADRDQPGAAACAARRCRGARRCGRSRRAPSRRCALRRRPATPRCSPCSRTPASGPARRSRCDWTDVRDADDPRASARSRSARTPTPRRTSTEPCGSSRRCARTSSSWRRSGARGTDLVFPGHDGERLVAAGLPVVAPPGLQARRAGRRRRAHARRTRSATRSPRCCSTRAAA